MRPFRTLTTGIRVFGGAARLKASDSSRQFVLVHGIGTSHRYMSRLRTELELDSTVYSLDLPGFGGAAKPGFSPSVREMALIMAASLDELAVRDAVLVGHSMGAQWAVELALLRPDLVSRVVAIGPVTDVAHRTLLAQARALTVDILGEPPLTNAVVFIDYLRCGSRYYLAQSKPMLSYPIDERVASLAQPLLVMRGGNDPIAGDDWCRVLVSRAPNGCLVTVPRNRHVVQFTAPKAVAGAIRSFVAEELGRPAARPARARASA
ncbi:alpha/beta fold hydrolase [Agreia sp.]|uniref:alpha/beta fold hydrolase n=1 Tax=Agreia sp. TaxID=1872416 RepID=UPI0035BBE629